MKDIYLGIDIGGTKMLASLVDDAGAVLARRKRPTEPERGARDVIARLGDMADDLLREFAAANGGRAPVVRGVGVAVPGVLDPAAGTVVMATNLAWSNVPIGPELAGRFRCPAQVLNDANAATYGEWRAGAGVGVDDLLYVTVSTGIGAGIVSGGRLVLGAWGSAAELGHISVDRDGPYCACGKRGCIEMYASGKSIARKVAEAAAAGAPGAADIRGLAGGDAAELTAEHVGAAARAGHPLALRALAEAGEALGRGIAAAAHLLNPALVVVGGGVSRCGEPLFGPMREAVRTHGIPGIVDGIRFVPSRLGEDAGAVGAALWCMEKPGAPVSV